MSQRDPLYKIIRKVPETAQPASAAEVKVRIDRRTGRATEGWSPFGSHEWYMVANSRDPGNVAVGTAPEIAVSDFVSGRGIGLLVSYEARCSPGVEVRLAESLFGGAQPGDIFHGFLNRWVSAFVGPRPADFIRHYYESRERLAAYVVQQAMRETGLALLVRLSLRDEEKFTQPVAVNPPAFPVRLRGCNEEQQLTLKAELSVDEQHRMSAFMNPLTDDQLGRLLTNLVRAYFSDSVTLNEFGADMNNGAFKTRVVSHLNGALRPYGRRLSYLLLAGRGAPPPPPFCEEHVDIIYAVQGHPDPVIIKSTVQMICRDPAGYVNAGSPKLRPWLEKNLDEIIRLVLFGKKYTDLLLNFDALEREIKNKLSFRAAAIGYDVQQLITIPDLEPYTWLEDFTLEAGREPGSDENGIAFPTRLSNFSVKLDFAVTTKINHLRDVAEYLNRHQNVPRLMKEVIVQEARRFLHTIEPERFYARFDYTEVAGEEPVATILARNIRAAFRQKFGADISSAIFKIVDDSKVRQSEHIFGKIGEFEAVISNSQEIGEVIIRGDFQADAIHPNGWSKFQVMNLDEAQMRSQIEKHLQSEMAHVPLWLLVSPEPEAVRTVRGKVEELIRNYIQKKYGLVVDVTNLRFEVAGSPTYAREQLEENFTTAQEAHAVMVRELTGNLYNLKKEIGQLIAAGFSEKEIEEKERRAEQLARYIASLSAPAWGGDRQIPGAEWYSPRGLPHQNGSESKAPDDAGGASE